MKTIIPQIIINLSFDTGKVSYWGEKFCTLYVHQQNWMSEKCRILMECSWNCNFGNSGGFLSKFSRSSIHLRDLKINLTCLKVFCRDRGRGNIIRVASVAWRANTSSEVLVVVPRFLHDSWRERNHWQRHRAGFGAAVDAVPIRRIFFDDILQFIGQIEGFHIKLVVVVRCPATMFFPSNSYS